MGKNQRKISSKKQMKEVANTKLSDEQVQSMQNDEMLRKRIRPIMIMDGNNDSFDPAAAFDRIRFVSSPEERQSPSTSVDIVPYDDNGYFDQDITQAMMARISSWPDAAREIASMGGTDKNPYLVNSYKGQIAGSVTLAINARLNYLINNAFSILTNDIIDILYKNSKLEKLFNDEPNLITNIQTTIVHQLYDFTANLDNNYDGPPAYCAGVKRSPVSIFMNNEKAETADKQYRIHAMSYTIADSAAINLVASASNVIYNALYRYLSLVVTTEFLQDLAYDLTPAFIVFRNTIVDIYRELYYEVAGCDLNISPTNILMMYEEDNDEE